MHLLGAEPFFLPGGRHGVLLIHGFTGLPAELRLMGEYLHAHGFTVLAIRLAGHGTTAEDLSRTEHEDWMDSVRDGYAILRGACDDIAVVGHSMGAIFALLLSIEAEVTCVVSLGAPRGERRSLCAEGAPQTGERSAGSEQHLSAYAARLRA